MPPCVSLCLIAKDEAANLPACLQSVSGLVDEIIVVDTGSADRTKEVANALGARVLEFAWVDSFSAARNESLRHATGDWILWLDGDEHFDDANRAKLRALLDGLQGEDAAFVMTQRSAPETIQGSPTEVTQVRLFRNHPQIRWSYRVHEQILPALRRAGHDVRFTDIVITHTGYVDPALRARKAQRNLRLLHLEEAEQPEDPFTQFNLGWTYHDLGQAERALPYLQRSLERSQPGDSIVRKLFALIAEGHRRLGQGRDALAVCRAGRVRCPDDPDLLFLEGILLREVGDRTGAHALWRQLVQVEPGAHFASCDAGLRGHKVRHQLALLAREEGQAAEAEAQWRSALAEQPAFGPARLGLAELYLDQGRWADLEDALDALPAEPAYVVEAAVLRARGQLARQEYAAARQTLEDVLARFPQAVKAHRYLTHALLQEGHDPAAMERALRALLERDPQQAEAWRNLALLLSRQGRTAEADTVCLAGRARCPQDAGLLLEHGLLLAEQRDEAAAEALLLRFLEMLPPGLALPDSPGGRFRPSVARHQLGLIYLRQGRSGEAEGQWRAVLAEQPDCREALLGLAQVCLKGHRWDELDRLIARLESGAEGALDATTLRGQRHLVRGELAEARHYFEEAIAHFPQAVWPRVLRSRVLLQEGREPAAAERALREVLALDPQNAEVRHNLAVFLAESGRAAEGAAGDRWSAAPDGQGAASAPYSQPDPVVEDRRTAFPGCPAQPDGLGRPSYGTNEFAARSVGPSEPSPVRALGRRDGEASPLAPGENGAGGEGPSLRLAFACYNPLPLQLDTPYRRPLGGSESALCYLAEALAGRGHQVFVLHPGPGPAASRGVCCLPLTDYSLRQLGPLDAFVVLNLAGQAQHLRPLLSPQTALVLWTGHHTDQPAVQPLRDPAERGRYDGFALVSAWQRQGFESAFGLDPARCGVLRNGIAPAFQDLFPEGTPIAARKSQPPVLAYTSTPYRGLDLLLEAFPGIRAAVPGATLKVFSGMGVYQIPAAEDQARFGALYQRCRETDGVEYLGPRPQPEVAAALTGATVLAYPNSYPETSCISVLEALAAGCQVVTSARGALPETTAGFARLVPVDGGREAYLDRFVEETVQALTRTGAEIEEPLRRQVAHVHRQHTWSALAESWVTWLHQLRAVVAG